MALTQLERRARIKKRIRKIVVGTEARPRLSVFRSNKEIYAQVINDANGTTLCSVASLRDESAHSGNKMEQAALVGKTLAEKAVAAGIVSVVFDRNGYQYHGRVKAFAEAAREGGLKF